MTIYDTAKELSKLTLGKTTEYTSTYAPTLLQGVPRDLNRKSLSINSANLPFFGEDVWYGYELSWLNEQGKPVVAVAEFRFPCTSTHLVESKSFKLYLNSFNQTRFPSWQHVQEALQKDLSQIAQSEATVTLYNVEKCPPLNIAKINAKCIDDLDITVENYDYTNEQLITINETASPIISESLVSHLLKSNCLITNQPDWASLYINYTGAKIDQATLLKYLISFRQHNEFHEQCVERIFCDLMQFGKFTELSVFARYTRRGGLDINPYRSTTKNIAPNIRTLRQ